MFTRKILKLWTALLLIFGLTAAAQAALIDRGGGLIYDDALDITWLQDANYAGVTMDWPQAMNWANNLVYYDSVRDVIWDDWRLPYATNLQNNGGGLGLGYKQDSEMGHMYYTNLGNIDYADSFHIGLQNTGDFINLQSDRYWSETPFVTDLGGVWMYSFDFNVGFQLGANANPNSNSEYAWAVRDGDVASVPEPGSLLLIGSGLICIILSSKK